MVLVGTAEAPHGRHLYRTSRTANRAQIDVEIFEFDADRVIEEVLDAGACRPAERRRWIVARARGLRADPEVAHGAACGRIKEEVGPSVASTQSKGAQPINPGLASCAGSQQRPTPRTEQPPLPVAPDQSKSPSKPSNTQSPKPA